jgi:hypothetical protein
LLLTSKTWLAPIKRQNIEELLEVIGIESLKPNDLDLHPFEKLSILPELLQSILDSNLEDVIPLFEKEHESSHIQYAALEAKKPIAEELTLLKAEEPSQSEQESVDALKSPRAKLNRSQRTSSIEMFMYELPLEVPNENIVLIG